MNYMLDILKDLFSLLILFAFIKIFIEIAAHIGKRLNFCDFFKSLKQKICR